MRRRLFAALFCGLIVPGLAITTHSPVFRCCPGRDFFVEVYPSIPPLFMTDAAGDFTGYIAELLQMVGDEMGLNVEVRPHAEDKYFEKFDNFFAGRTHAILDSTVQRQAVYLEPDTELYGGSPSLLKYGRMLPDLPSVVIVSDSYGALLHRVVVTDDGWRLFLPFENRLWVGIVLAVLAFAVLLVLLDTIALSNAAERPADLPLFRAEKFAKALYHGLSSVFNGDDLAVHSWPGRILRLGMLFFVLVTTATYTANLAAYFTAERVRIRGPQSMRELLETDVHTVNPFVADRIRRFVKSSIPAFNREGTAPLGSVDAWNNSAAAEWGMALLEAQQAEAYVSSLSELRFFALDRCRSVHVSEHLRFGRFDYALWFRPEDLALSANLSVALDWLADQPSFTALQDRYFGTASPCAAPDAPLPSVSFNSQQGLFVIFACVAALSLLLALAQASAHPRLGPQSPSSLERKPVPALSPAPTLLCRHPAPFHPSASPVPAVHTATGSDPLLGAVLEQVLHIRAGIEAMDGSRVATARHGTAVYPQPALLHRTPWRRAPGEASALVHSAGGPLSPASAQLESPHTWTATAAARAPAAPNPALRGGRQGMQEEEGSAIGQQFFA